MQVFKHELWPEPVPKHAEPPGQPVKSHIVLVHMPPGIARHELCAQLASLLQAWPMSFAGAASPGQR